MKSLIAASTNPVAALSLTAFLLFSPLPAGSAFAADVPDDNGHESELLSGARQLTFEGKRAGEGYFEVPYAPP